jgi:hypothetical protein
MTKLIVFVVSIVAFAQAAWSQSGHIPTPHQHRTNGNGVCYGYAMGRSGNAQGDCNPATIVRADADPDDANANLAWSVDGSYWDDPMGGATLSGVAAGDIIAFGTGHVAYASSVTNHPNGGYIIQVDDILSWGASVTTGVTLERVQSGSDWNYKRTSSLTATGYYTVKSFDVKAQNHFYNGSNPDTNHGNITIASTTQQSPLTVSKKWNGSYTAVAQSEHDYPTGYKQLFNNLWKKNITDDAGTTLEIPVEVRSSLNTYEAQYYEAAGVTFTPVGGGGITVDGQTRYTTYTTYAKTNPPPADQVQATAVNTTVDRISYNLAYWTNGASSDTTYDYSISFYPSAAVTYTAHFSPKPLPPDNVWAGGTVGDYVHITWTQHPNSSVTYQIWRKVKENGVLGSPVLLTELGNATTSYIDYDYLITSGYVDDIAYYDVRSKLVVGGTTYYSDPSYTGGVFTTNNQRIVAENDQRGHIAAAGEQAADYHVSIYPNPFNPSTTLSYQLPQDAAVRLEVYDMIGRKVRSLVDESKSAGYYRVVWNGRDETGRDVASGVYLYRFSATPIDGSKVVVRAGKLMLMR